MPILKIVNPQKGSKRKVKSILDYGFKSSDFKKIKTYRLEHKTAYGISQEMESIKELYGKKGGRQYNHMVLSFPKNTRDSYINQVTESFIEKSGKFEGHQTVVIYHENHGHIITNTVNSNTGLKFHMTKNELHEMKKLTNELSETYGIKSPELPDRKKRSDKNFTTEGTFSMKEHKVKEKGESYKDQLKNDFIEIYKSNPQSKKDFENLMNEKGYELSERGKNLSFKIKTRNDKEIKVRLNNLIDTYGKSLKEEGIDLTGREDLYNQFKINQIRKEEEEKRRKAEEQSQEMKTENEKREEENINAPKEKEPEIKKPIAEKPKYSYKNNRKSYINVPGINDYDREREY